MVAKSLAGPARLTCGIAMCTCNGMPYLPQQLDSLLQQDRLPDQIAIHDDASDDGSWEYLQQWAARQSIDVKLVRNEPRLGVVRNFEAAVQSLQTDLIFLCDQDDVWLPFKISLLSQQFEQDPALTLLHSDARLVDAQGVDMQASLFQSLGLSEEERGWVAQGRALDVLCRRNIVTGAAAVFRRDLLSLALPFSPDWVHDEWLAILAAAKGKMRSEPSSTVQYREHGRNAIGMEAPGLARLVKRFRFVMALPESKFQLLRLTRVEQLKARLEREGSLNPDLAAMLSDWLRFARFRAGLSRYLPLRILAVLRHAVITSDYRRFGRGPLSALRDVLMR